MNIKPGQLVCVDLDGTLCKPGGGWDKEGCLNAEPYPDRIAKVNQMVREGIHIIIRTARKMDTIKETTSWLLLNNVDYHGIAMGQKPGSDWYIDDKAINADDFFGK